MSKPGDRDVAARRATSRAPLMQEVVALRLSRRTFLQGTITAALAAGIGIHRKAVAAEGAAPTGDVDRFVFRELPRATGNDHAVAPGHDVDVLIRWGDPLFNNSPPFNVRSQTAAAQARQFGYNNDFLGFIPLPDKADGAARGLLCVNHEYATSYLMFPRKLRKDPAQAAEVCAIEMAAHGGSVVEIEEHGGRWRVVVDSPFNRRIMAQGTPMRISGPAAGHPRLRTQGDPTGTQVGGTVNNCAGGITPWQTWLMGEENFNGAFTGSVDADHPEARNHEIYGVPDSYYKWGRFHATFDLDREPRSPNRFGWVVEVDPLEPTSVPRKRTALGRFKHEGAESTVTRDGRIAVYMGDDEKFEYVYKFVSERKFVPGDRAANADLLDHGTLHVARFNADGTLNWLPLVYGQGALTPKNDFHDQGDVLIETRRAADLLGATPMDRPEDVQASPVTGKVYVMLTNNDRRSSSQTDAANPRARNTEGHIIEITEAGSDAAALSARWDMLVRCGDPASPRVAALWNPRTTADGWFGSPDNCAFDAMGRMWVATDGNDGADGLWGVETEGALRGTSRAFYRAPVGAEVCGPCFTPDGQSLFLAIQHPGDAFGASFERPLTRWPDFDERMPPRPAVVVIRRQGGGVVGT